MTHRHDYRPDNWDEPDDDQEGSDDELPEGVFYDDGAEVTTPCPYCREPVYEDAQYCPRCENYLSEEEAPSARKPLWIWVLLILALVATFWSAFC